MPTDFYIKLRGHIWHFDKPVVMGIINATPDSFFSQSRAADVEAVRQRARQMAAEGVDIIDIGACSTRPGASLPSAAEELDRLAPAIEAIRAEVPDIPVSVDTFRSSVARIAVSELGAGIVNDVSGGNADQEMFQTVADLHVPYVYTHMLGYPGCADMPAYGNFEAEVIADIENKVHSLNLLGVNDIILDPGFGFNKTLEQNYALMRMLPTLSIWKLPILVGISRKSMITKMLGIKAEDALCGTVALNTCALWQGASILRVHDVAAAKQAIEIFINSHPTDCLC